VYQAGTLSGNPLAVAAGLAMLDTLEKTNPYSELEKNSERLARGLDQAATDAGLPHSVARVGSMFTLFFHDEPVSNFKTALRCDTKRFAKYFWGMLERGHYLPCSQFEANFVSTLHTPELVDTTLADAREVLTEIAAETN
jgi:glutamate-1-semialdehyde 2,1-aminomutase